MSDDTDNHDGDRIEAAGETMYNAIRDWAASGYEPDPCIVTRFHVIAECDDGETRWLEYGGFSADGAPLTDWETTGLLQHASEARTARMITERLIDAASDGEGDE